MTSEQDQDINIKNIEKLRNTLETKTKWAVYVCTTDGCYSLKPVPTFVIANGILRTQAPQTIQCMKCKGIMKLK